jgi:hypothetical protein
MQLSKDDKECSFECSSLSLGALMKGMNVMRLDPPPTGSFDGYSVSAMEKAIGDIKIPNYSQLLHHSPTYTASTISAYSTNSAGGFIIFNTDRSCNLNKKIELIIQAQSTSLCGLSLNTFVN